MRPPQTHALPVVLSREEVWRILSLVRLPVYRAQPPKPENPKRGP